MKWRSYHRKLKVETNDSNVNMKTKTSMVLTKAIKIDVLSNNMIIKEKDITTSKIQTKLMNEPKIPFNKILIRFGLFVPDIRRVYDQFFQEKKDGQSDWVSNALRALNVLDCPISVWSNIVTFDDFMNLYASLSEVDVESKQSDVWIPIISTGKWIEVDENTCDRLLFAIEPFNISNFNTIFTFAEERGKAASFNEVQVSFQDIIDILIITGMKHISKEMIELTDSILKPFQVNKDILKFQVSIYPL